MCRPKRSDLSQPVIAAVPIISNAASAAVILWRPGEDVSNHHPASERRACTPPGLQCGGRKQHVHALCSLPCRMHARKDMNMPAAAKLSVLYSPSSNVHLYTSLAFLSCRQRENDCLVPMMCARSHEAIIKLERNHLYHWVSCS